MTFIIHPISDLCARLKNAHLAGLKNTKVVYSKLAMSVLKALKDDGYIMDYFHQDEKYVQENKLDKSQKYLINVTLKYDNRGVPIIRYISTISKPSKRVYTGFKGFKAREQYSTLIISTSLGILSHHDARRARAGGEVLLEVAS
jgi:small subunit ribosomal protein S8